MKKTNLFLLAVFIFNTATETKAQAFDQQLLSEPGLNSDSQPLLHFTLFVLNRWMEENASLVIGLQGDGVTPHEGDGMVKLIDDGLNASQVRQRIDVSNLSDSIDGGSVIAEVDGWVNASIGGVGGGVNVSAYDESETYIAVDYGAFTLDSDVATWEYSSAQLDLPIGTRFVEYQFAFNNNSLPANEAAYGDQPTLILRGLSESVPAPIFSHAGLTLLILMIIAIVSWNFRRDVY